MTSPRLTCSGPYPASPRCRDRRGHRPPAAASGWSRTPSARACSTSPTAPSTRPVGALLLAAHAGRAGPGGVRAGGPRPGAGPAGRPDQPAGAARAGPAGRRPRGSSRSTSPAAGATSTCRWTCGWRTGSGVTVLTRLPEIGYGTDRELRGGGRRRRQPEGGARRRHGLRDQPAAGGGALPPGRPQRRLGRQVRRRRRGEADPAGAGGRAARATVSPCPGPWTVSSSSTCPGRWPGRTRR